MASLLNYVPYLAMNTMRARPALEQHQQEQQQPRTAKKLLTGYMSLYGVHLTFMWISCDFTRVSCDFIWISYGFIWIYNSCVWLSCLIILIFIILIIIIRIIIIIIMLGASPPAAGPCPQVLVTLGAIPLSPTWA